MNIADGNYSDFFGCMIVNNIIQGIASKHSENLNTLKTNI
jgi:hypothetical protein